MVVFCSQMIFMINFKIAGKMKEFVQRDPDQSSCFPALLLILSLFFPCSPHSPSFPLLFRLWLDELWSIKPELGLSSSFMCRFCLFPKIDSTPFSACSVPWAAPPRPYASLTWASS